MECNPLVVFVLFFFTNYCENIFHEINDIYNLPQPHAFRTREPYYVANCQVVRNNFGRHACYIIPMTSPGAGAMTPPGAVTPPGNGAVTPYGAWAVTPPGAGAGVVTSPAKKM